MFGINNYGAFVIAFILLWLLPGPGNLALITSTSKGGIPGGLAATFDIMMGDQVLLWLAVAGVAALLSAYPQAFQAVQLLGAAYLAWLGLSLLLAKPGGPPIFNIRSRHYFYQALVITLLNPKAIVFYMAFFPLFIDPVRSQGLVTYAAMSVTILILAFIYCVSVVLISHYMAERIRSNPKVTNAMQKIAGAFLIGFGVKLALGK
jgi:leucine efflux protein